MATVNKKNIKAVTRLIEAGYTSEKDISTVGINELLKIPGITVAEMEAIVELQKAIKAGKVIAFLCEAGGEKANEA